MTFSIVAADVSAGDWGIAVASKFPCVGAVVPWARAGTGAVATQSWANTSFGPEGLELMAAGVGAQPALDRLLAADDGREDRQVGFVDASGHAATFTGSKCMTWAGGVTGDGFAAQGNILAGEAVVAELARAFTETEGDLCDRLAGRARGRRRGRRGQAWPAIRGAAGRPRRRRVRGAQRPLHRPARRRPCGSDQRARPDLRRVGRVDARAERSAAGTDRRSS